MSGVDSTNKQPENAASSSTAKARKPYRTPKLMHLGSVRNLTYGTGQMVTDGGGLPTGAQGIGM